MSAFINENTQFVGVNGKPIVNGKLYIGVKGLDPILNDIPIFSDRALSIPLSNPQTLDAFGRSSNKIWIPSLYSLRVDNTNDVQKLIDLDAGDLQTTGTTILFDIQGTNTITATASPTIEAYVDGQIYVFKPANDNTGAVTLNIDSLGAKNILLFGSAIAVGALRAGFNHAVIYNGDNDNFDLSIKSNSGGLRSIQVFTSSGTWTKPAGVGLVRVVVIGAGGGGGGADGQGAGTNAGAGGGSGGGYTESLLNVTAIATSTITVGAGGSGGAAGNNNGVAGGGSTWVDGTNTLTGGGGGIGKGILGGATTAWSTSNVGGTGSGGNINGVGGIGGTGRAGQVQNTAKSGYGGSSFIAGNGLEVLANNAAVAGIDGEANTGQGGGGAATEEVATNAAGGDGADGIIIVYEFAA